MIASARTRLTPAEASRAMLSEIAATAPVHVPLADALGLVLAADVTSPIDIPPWDNSAMDGYAARAADVREGAELTIVETIAAGDSPTRTLGPVECARIFTGAPVPPGADSVIRQEHATPLDEHRVRIDDPHDAGRNIRPRGEDIVSGSGR
jgi:molybdopterin biosynthesis enzyme